LNANSECAVCKRSYLSEQDYLTNTSRWRICSKGNLWFNCSCGSTLMIPRGRYDWYAPDKFMGSEARTVFNRLGNLKDLPHIPSSVLELQRLLSSPDVEPRRVAAELRHDPVLAAQVLQIAENLRASRNPATPKIKALEHAIVYVGMKTLKEMIVLSSLRMLPLPPSALDLDRFWQESYLTGAIAETLASRANAPVDRDEAFLAGCLANIGKIVEVHCFAPTIEKLVADTTDVKKLSTWRSAEAHHGLPDHSVLGEIASTLWGFPDYIMTAARRHHDVPTTAVTRPLAAFEIVGMANQMRHWIQLEPHLMEYEVVRGYAARAGMTDKQVEALASDLSKLKDSVGAPIPAANVV
jgi:HD-like signal output (HDOD) protein